MGERFAGVVGVGFVWVRVRVLWGVVVRESSHGFASVARASGLFIINGIFSGCF